MSVVLTDMTFHIVRQVIANKCYINNRALVASSECGRKSCVRQDYVERRESLQEWSPSGICTFVHLYKVARDDTGVSTIGLNNYFIQQCVVVLLSKTWCGVAAEPVYAVCFSKALFRYVQKTSLKCKISTGPDRRFACYVWNPSAVCGHLVGLRYYGHVNVQLANGLR